MTSSVPFEVMRVAGRFDPPTLAIQYRQRGGKAKMYPMAIDDDMLEGDLETLLERLRQGHPIFRNLPVSRVQIVRVLGKIRDGHRKKIEARLAEIEARQRALEQEDREQASRLVLGEADDQEERDDGLLMIRQHTSPKLRYSPRQRASPHFLSGLDDDADDDNRDEALIATVVVGRPTVPPTQRSRKPEQRQQTAAVMTLEQLAAMADEEEEEQDDDLEGLPFAPVPIHADPPMGASSTGSDDYTDELRRSQSPEFGCGRSSARRSRDRYEGAAACGGGNDRADAATRRALLLSSLAEDSLMLSHALSRMRESVWADNGDDDEQERW
jgi:hypothetical protein